MAKRMVVALALAVCSVAGARGQMGQTAPKVPAGTIIEPSKSFDALLKIYEGEMMGAVNAMPAEKYNWRPAPGVRSVSEVYMHIAGANYFLASFVGMKMPSYDTTKFEKISDKPSAINR